MAADMIAGAHGRDVTPAEAAWSVPHPVTLDGPITFRSVLNAMNPLQYLPVVGTIYRVVTGDRGSPPLQTAMSMITGAVMGGPVGLLTSIAGALVEHFLHPEEIAHSILAGAPAAGATAPAAHTPAAPVPAALIPAALLPAASGPAASVPAAPGPAAPAAAPAIRSAFQATVESSAAAALPAPSQVLAEAVAAYARVADLPTRIVWGGAQR